MVVQVTKVTLSLKFRRGDCAEDGAVAVSWVKRGSGVYENIKGDGSWVGSCGK